MIPGKRSLRPVGFAAVVLLGLLLVAVGPVALGSGAITITGEGGVAAPGGAVSYALTVSNAGSAGASVVVSQTLPPRFTYRAGSTIVRVNDRVVSEQDPAVEGRQLTWPPIELPAAVYTSANHFGIHSFVQDLCTPGYVDFQLDKARDLVGDGGYVKQMFYSIGAETTGPQECWVHFVDAAYDRGLIPIIRLQGRYDDRLGYWIKPQPDAPDDYSTVARAYRRVVEGLPRRDGRPLYVEIWNEPDLRTSWSDAPGAREYGEFFVDVATAIRDIGEPRIRVLNGALTPGNSTFVAELMAVPGFAQAFDAWAAHAYPYNHPPSYNLHRGSARYAEFAIDSYLMERAVLAAYGRGDAGILLTEAGHGLDDDAFAFEGYPAIEEHNRAEYISQAFADYWSAWPEVLAACGFELVAPYGDWRWMDWLHPTTGAHHEQYDVVAALPKPVPEVAPARATIAFQATAASQPGEYTSRLELTADGLVLAVVEQAAPVRVRDLAQPIPPDGMEPSPRRTSGEAPGGVPQYAILSPPDGEIAAAGQPVIARRASLAGRGIALAVEPTGGQAYVLQRAGEVAVVDLVRGRVERTFSLPIEADALAYDAGSALLYAARSADDVVLAVDATTGRVLSRAAVGPGPVAIAVNPDRGRVYVAAAGDGAVQVLDRALRPVQRVQVARPPLLGLALDERRGWLYVVHPLVPGRHGITVLDETRFEKVATWGGDGRHRLGGLRGVAVNPDDGLLLASDRDRLLMIDPQGGALLSDWPDAGGVEAIAAGRLYTLDAEGATLLWGAMPGALQ